MCPEGLELKEAADCAEGPEAAKLAHDSLVAHVHVCETCRAHEREPEVD